MWKCRRAAGPLPRPSPSGEGARKHPFNPCPESADSRLSIQLLVCAMLCLYGLGGRVAWMEAQGWFDDAGLTPEEFRRLL